MRRAKKRPFRASLDHSKEASIISRTVKMFGAEGEGPRLLAGSRRALLLSGTDEKGGRGAEEKK